MEKKTYVYWQEEKMWIGYLEEYPDYMTQGETIEELEVNLKDIYRELTGGAIPNVRRVAELEMAERGEWMVFDLVSSLLLPRSVFRMKEV